MAARLVHAGLITLVAVTALATMVLPSSAAPSSEQACPTGQVVSPGFADVTGTHAATIDCLAWWGITAGTSADRVGRPLYDPSGRASRAQMATFIHRLLQQANTNLPAPTDNPFGDVAMDDVHHDPIVSLFNAGVVNGTSDTTYSPDNNVTRAQVASLIDRTHREVFGKSVAEQQEAFSDVTGGPHRDAIGRMAASGIATGYGDGTFGPSDPVTRAQMASFLMRYADLLVEQGHTEAPSERDGYLRPIQVTDEGIDGAPTDESLVPWLTEQLGPADQDTGWQVEECLGEGEFRWVTWGPLTVALDRIDGEVFYRAARFDLTQPAHPDLHLPHGFHHGMVWQDAADLGAVAPTNQYWEIPERWAGGQFQDWTGPPQSTPPPDEPLSTVIVGGVGFFYVAGC